MLCKYGEIVLKGANRKYFEDMLCREMKKRAKAYGNFDTDKLLSLVKGRVQIFSEIGEKLDFLTEFGAFDLALFENQKQKASIELAKTLIPEIKKALENVTDWNNSTLFETLVNLSTALEIKKQAVLWISRIAITAKEATAGGATEIAELLGKEETLNRLDFSIDLLNK